MYMQLFEGRYSKLSDKSMYADIKANCYNFKIYSIENTSTLSPPCGYIIKCDILLVH